jgi:TetR/AcrR family transcriptional regulator, transcriptional repressor of bet genes
VPRIVDQDEKRATIARAAYDVINTVGIGGATMRAIARQAGCTTGMVVHYFSGKQDVLLHAHNHAAQDVRRRMVEHERRHRGVALLFALIEEVLPMDARRRGNWRIWMSFWDESVAEASVRGEQSRRVVEWHRRLRRALAQALEAGEIDPAVNVRDEVDVIASLVEGLAIQVIAHRRAISAPRQVRLIREYIRRLSASRT